MPGGKVLDALWDFSRVCGTFDERIKDPGIPTQLPEELVKRASPASPTPAIGCSTVRRHRHDRPRASSRRSRF
jgi:hypothetical protein